MTRSLETASDMARAMPGRWRVGDAKIALDFAGGLSAALLHAQPGEVAAPPGGAHIVCMALKGAQQHDAWCDHKLILSGPLPARRVHLINAGVRPRAAFTAAIPCLHVYVPPDLLVRQAEQSGAGDAARDLTVRDPHFALDSPLESLLSSIASALRERDWASRMWLESLGAALAARLIQRWSSLSANKSTHISIECWNIRDWRMRRAIEYMDARLGDDIGLVELAKEVGLSSSHFAAMFQSATGLPPHRWLMKRRVDRACEMLADARQSVTELAHALGFASSQHLATVFKKHMGVTPTEYRNERLG